MSAVITAAQFVVMKALRDLDRRDTDRIYAGFGFNPGDFGGPSAAAIARRVERKGYVEIKRVTDHHLRYRLTTSGEQLLAYIEAGRPWLVTKGRA